MVSIEFNLLHLAYFIGIALPISFAALVLSGYHLKGRKLVYGLILTAFTAIIIGVISSIISIAFELFFPIEIADIPKEFFGMPLAKWISLALVSGIVFLFVILRGILSNKGKGVPKWEDVSKGRESEDEKKAMSFGEPASYNPNESERDIFDRRLKQAEEEAERKIEKQEIKNIIIEKAQRAPLILEKGLSETSAKEKIDEPKEKTFEKKESKVEQFFKKKEEPEKKEPEFQVTAQENLAITKEENEEESNMDVDAEKQRILDRIKQKLKDAQNENHAPAELPKEEYASEDVKKALQSELKSLVQKEAAEDAAAEGRIVESEEKRESARQELLPSLEELEVPARKFNAVEQVKKEQPKKKGFLSGIFKKK